MHPCRDAPGSSDESGNYASAIGKTTLLVDVDDNTICSVAANENLTAPSFDEATQAAERDAYVAAGGARGLTIQQIVTDALANAEVLGAPVIADATAAISRGTNPDGTLDNRAVESTMSNLVAQMFYDVLGGGDPNFIGVQNPGGTRADFDSGDITYAEAAAVLPFANTLMTTQLTGAQVKMMLEQQWQPDPTVRRPFLALGLSDNVSYTYDESRARGDRILGVFINGMPIDPEALYTIGSGSFLIGGGDGFSVIGEGLDPTDTGRADLEAWVEWLHGKATVSPDYAKRGVPFVGETALTVGVGVNWIVGQPIDVSLTKQTLDMQALGAPANTVLNAYLGSATGPLAGTVTVVNGVAMLTLTIPAGTPTGPAYIYLVADPSGTVAIIPVTITAAPQPAPLPDKPAPLPGKPTALPKTGVARCKIAEGGNQHSLDGVHPVLGLVEDHLGVRLEDVVGDLEGIHAGRLVELAADTGAQVVEGRQAVQHLGRRVLRPGHRGCVHLGSPAARRSGRCRPPRAHPWRRASV